MGRTVADNEDFWFEIKWKEDKSITRTGYDPGNTCHVRVSSDVLSGGAAFQMSLFIIESMLGFG